MREVRGGARWEVFFFLWGQRLPWKGIMASSFFISPPPLSVCYIHVICMYVGGGMGCAHVKYGGQKSMLGIFLERVPIFV